MTRTARPPHRRRRIPERSVDGTITAPSLVVPSVRATQKPACPRRPRPARRRPPVAVVHVARLAAAAVTRGPSPLRDLRQAGPQGRHGQRHAAGAIAPFGEGGQAGGRDREGGGEPPAVVGGLGLIESRRDDQVGLVEPAQHEVVGLQADRRQVVPAPPVEHTLGTPRVEDADPAATARSCRPGTEPCATTPGPANRTIRRRRPRPRPLPRPARPRCRRVPGTAGRSSRPAHPGPARSESPLRLPNDSAGTAATNASAESASMVRHGSCPSPGSQNTPSPRCTPARAPWTLVRQREDGRKRTGHRHDLERTEGCPVRGVDARDQGHASPELGRGDGGHVVRSTAAESRLKELRTPRSWPSGAPASRRRPRGPRPGRDGPTWRPAPPPRPCRRR